MTTLANAHYVDSDINGSVSAAVAAWVSTVYSSQARGIAHPINRSHLEGQTVDVLDDGVATTGVITSGALVPVLTGTLHIGLNYVSTMKPTKLDWEQMGMIVTKKITMVVISFYNTLMGKITMPKKTDTVSFSTTLFEGIKEVPLTGGYEREGDITVIQDKPCPMTVRGLIINLGVHDKG